MQTSEASDKLESLLVSSGDRGTWYQRVGVRASVTGVWGLLYTTGWCYPIYQHHYHLHFANDYIRKLWLPRIKWDALKSQSRCL